MVGLLALVFDAPLTELELPGDLRPGQAPILQPQHLQGPLTQLHRAWQCRRGIGAQVERISLGHGAGLAQHFLPIGLVHALRAAKLLQQGQQRRALPAEQPDKVVAFGPAEHLGQLRFPQRVPGAVTDDGFQ